MLLYSSYHGRKQHWQVEESEYDKLNGAFGRVPIVIHLGDFLQLKPTATTISLISGKLEIEGQGEGIPSEQQSAMKLFCQTHLCFELKESNRFKDEKLSALMDVMRNPLDDVNPEIEAICKSIQLRSRTHVLKRNVFRMAT